MKLVKRILLASVFALTAGSAFAEKAKTDPGFNALDKNNDGWLTRAEARKNPYLSKNFKAADTNSDGKLSRTEYLKIMTKKDLSSVKEKVSGDKDRNAATGASKPAK